MAAGDGDGTSAPDDSDGTNRASQAGLAALCVLGLLVAAVAVPAASPAGAPDIGGPGDGSTPDEAPADGEVDDPGGRIPGLVDLLRWLLPDEEPSDDDPTSPRCELSVDPAPTPGRLVSVTVTRDGAPVAGALVRFQGEPVGRTDETGQVHGRVPYVRTLAVSARIPGGGGCGADAATGPQPAAAIAAPPLAPAASSPLAQATLDGSNISQSFEVDGAVSLSVVGDADPGETVTVRARIEGIPMREATVAANGRSVATTGDDGAATVRVPDDGTERLRIRVERGAFAGTTTVAVRLLRAQVVTNAPLALPGEPAAVRATIGDEPAADAVVTLEGRRLGRTDEDGHLDIGLPADPRATLTVRRGDRVATAGVALLYAGTAAIVGLPLLVLVGAVAVASRHGATPGRLAGLLRRLARALGALGRRLVGVAFLVATAVERVLGWVLASARRLLALAGRLAALARAGLPALLGALRARLRTVPAGTMERLRRTWAWLRRLPERTWRLLRSGRSESAADGPAQGWLATGEAFDLRRAWRAVASRVAPASWRVRTPGEVVRAAADRGLPREPMARLAGIFEEVEYGGRSLSAERRERARAAAAALVARDPPPDEASPGVESPIEIARGETGRGDDPDGGGDRP